MLLMSLLQVNEWGKSSNVNQVNFPSLFEILRWLALSLRNSTMALLESSGSCWKKRSLLKLFFKVLKEAIHWTSFLRQSNKIPCVCETENYTAEVWKRYQAFTHSKDSWPSYKKDNCYPLLVRITVWTFLLI